MAKANQNANEQKATISRSELKERIEKKLHSRGIPTPQNATSEQLYHGVVYALKDIILERKYWGKA
jgi:hypothetical protein